MGVLFQLVLSQKNKSNTVEKINKQDDKNDNDNVDKNKEEQNLNK